MTITEFDNLEGNRKREILLNCCGSAAWVKAMLEVFRFEDLADLLEYAEEKWYECNPADWLEAFGHHVRIGDINSLKEEYYDKMDFASDEQSRLLTTSESVLEELKKENQEYEETFGYIFIVYATGKSASEMLEIIRQRLLNDPREELMVAAAEQDKITKLRLKKLFD